MKLRTLFFASLISASGLSAQPTQKIAATDIHPPPTAPVPADEALLLNGRIAEWQATANANFPTIQSMVDRDKLLSSTPSSSGGDTPPANLNVFERGRRLVFLYRVTQDKKYALAAQALENQLGLQPRTPSGLYNDGSLASLQVSLWDAYSTAPFRASYAATFQQPQDFNDIATQLLLLETALRDQKAGLMHHSWHDSSQTYFAQPPTFLAQPTGLYAMALVDTLDWFPRDHPQRAALIASLNRISAAILKVQDPATGLWWRALDRAPHRSMGLHRQPDGSLAISLNAENDTNVLEPASSAMFAYTLAKGVRLGYLPQSDEAAALHAWAGIRKETASDAQPSCLALTSNASPCPPFFAGAFLLASSELDDASASAQSPGPAPSGLLPSSKDFHAPASAPQTHRITAMVDAWFNSQTRKNALGQTELFHYKWDDDASSGYSFFGRAFQRHNADLATLPTAPTRANLAAAQVYIIASPDIPSKNPHPHYMDQPSGDAIEAWVRSGGVLILFSNDRDNTEFTHFNTLADRFGIHFNPVLSHHVIEPDHSTGEVVIPSKTGIFSSGFTAYMKDTSTITPTGPARAVVTDHGDVMIAQAHVGKGTVLAIVDPWFYNEYADGRKMRQYHGFEAANDIAAWAVRHATPKNLALKQPKSSSPER